ncbi:transcriptional regulator [Bradyrhizobium sp. 177]|uniref:helix-turn-helix domain-containing protein n=1 Tax=Bradyrhizobium sp. 177 TaxID=2782647 RepID=UPI001FF82EBA|nr:helix-turn-helix domain-containing protein [Bradyrhizobium sp. 177]MCK1553147.1 transcriptional regulator [Bradyrhizobium sp. 177]
MSETELLPPGRLAYSISEFCQAVGVSRSYFYSLSDEAKPRIVKRGGRLFIPVDAAREWLSTAGIAA